MLGHVADRMARLLDSIFAPADAARPQIRRAGAVRFVLGAVIVATAFAWAARDVRLSHGVLAEHGGVRLLLALVVAVGVGFAFGGLYAAAFGIARGAEIAGVGRAAQGVFVLVAIAAVFASLVAFLGVSTPDEPALPAARDPGFRLPGPNERSVTYQVGDGAITIERVTRDAG